MRAFSLLILSLLAFLFLCSAVLIGVPGEFAEKALWVTIICPIIWLGFMFACYWFGSIKWVAAGLVLVTLLCGAMVFLTDTQALLASVASEPN